MTFLFVVKQKKNVDTFEGVIDALLEGGHTVKLAVQQRDEERDRRLLERFASPRFELVSPPDGRGDRWRSAAPLVRAARDLAQYSRPSYRAASKLRQRAADRFLKALGAAGRLDAEAVSLGTQTSETVRSALEQLERAMPSDALHEEFLARHAPDAVLVTPGVHFGSVQSDVIKSAQARGIPVWMLLFSWDNLSSKGALHVAPDLLFVWNERQRLEAEQLHDFPPDRVVVVGAPRFDGFFALRPQVSRHAFLAPLGLDPSRPVLLYVCSSRFIAERELPFVRQWLAAVQGRARATALLACHRASSPGHRAGPGESGGDCCVGRPSAGDRLGAAPVRRFRRPRPANDLCHAAGVLRVPASCGGGGGPQHQRRAGGRHRRPSCPDDARRARPAPTASAARCTSTICCERTAASWPAHPRWRSTSRPWPRRSRSRPIRRPSPASSANSCGRAATSRSRRCWRGCSSSGRARTFVERRRPRASWHRPRRRPRTKHLDVEAPSIAAPGKLLSVHTPGAAARVHVTPETRRWRRAGVLHLDPFAVGWLAERMQPGDVLYDIGAGIGAYAILAAMERGGLAVAFEPGFASFSRLCDNLLLNGCYRSVIPVPAALSDRTGLAEMVYPHTPGEDTHAVTERRWRARLDRVESRYTQPVCADRLDDLVARQRLPAPHVVRVNVRKAADRVLAGAANVLGQPQVRSVLVSVPDESSVEPILRAVEGLGFSHTLSPAGGGFDASLCLVRSGPVRRHPLQAVRRAVAGLRSGTGRVIRPR